MARLGIRGFKPGLRQAAKRLEQLRTPEGVPVPPHTPAELRHDLDRLGLISPREGGDQIGEIEAARIERMRQHPDAASHPMILPLARVVGVGIETADMLVQEVLSRNLRDRRAVARSLSSGRAPRGPGGRVDRIARGKRRPRKRLGQACPWQ